MALEGRPGKACLSGGRPCAGSGQPGDRLTARQEVNPSTKKAAAQLPAVPTSDAILNGLWTFKTETLDGLSMPLTFTRDQNTPRQICWGKNITQGGKWVAFNGGRITCV